MKRKKTTGNRKIKKYEIIFKF